VTRVDHRKPPARAARKQQRAAERRNAPPVRKRKAQRSRSAISAAIVSGLALVAVFAFILTRGTNGGQTADGIRMGSGTDNGAAAPAASATGSATKGDRKPPVSARTHPTVKTQPTVKAQTTTPPPVNTGPTSPKFKHGEWIAVLDKYQADGEQAAKDTATRLSRAGIPAKAMLVNGQYPGVTDSSLAPVTGTWVIYLGPGSSSEQMLNLCQDPRTQKAYPGPCPTYEPAG
jgi:hypothetical protein